MGTARIYNNNKTSKTLTQVENESPLMVYFLLSSIFLILLMMFLWIIFSLIVYIALGISNINKIAQDFKNASKIFVIESKYSISSQNINKLIINSVIPIVII